jgi:hypothetical protein
MCVICYMSYRWPPCHVGTAVSCHACPCHGPSLRPTARHMGHRTVLRAWRATGSRGAVTERVVVWQSRRRSFGPEPRVELGRKWTTGGAGSVSGRRGAFAPLWWGARGGGLAGSRQSSPVRRRRPGGALPRAHKEEVCRRPGLLAREREEEEGRRSADGRPAAATATAMVTQRGARAVPATVPRPWPCRASVVSWAWPAAHDTHWPSCRAGTGTVRAMPCGPWVVPKGRVAGPWAAWPYIA